MPMFCLTVDREQYFSCWKTWLIVSKWLVRQIFCLKWKPHGLSKANKFSAHPSLLNILKVHTWYFFSTTFNLEATSWKRTQHEIHSPWKPLKEPKYLVVGNYVWFLVHWPFSPDVRNWSLASLTMTINFETRALLILLTTKSYSKKIVLPAIYFPHPHSPLEQHKNCRPVFLRTFLRTFHHGFLFGRLSCSVSKPTQEANFFPAQLDLPSGKSEWIDIETSEGNLFFMGKGSQTIAFRADLSRMVSSLIENIWNMESARLMQSNFNIWLKLIKYLWTMVNSWNAWIESYGRKSRYVFGCTDEIAGYTDIQIDTCSIYLCECPEKGNILTESLSPWVENSSLIFWSTGWWS